jgi:hypothetical protein
MEDMLMRLFVLLLTVMLCVAGICGTASAVGNIYGATGMIETPSDLTVPKSTTTLTGTYIADYMDTKDSLTAWGGAYGVSDKFEVSWTSFKSDASGSGSQSITGAKLNVTQESSTSPGMSIGVVDLGNNIKHLNSGIDETSYYVVFGRTLSAELDRFRTNKTTTPVRGTIGFGKGIYSGVFGALDFYVAPRFEMKLEYLNKGLRDKSTLNAVMQMNLLPNLTIQAGSLAMKDFYGSVSYTLGGQF